MVKAVESSAESRAVLVCHRSNQSRPVAAEFTYWDSAEQARQAGAELTPCGPLCISAHTVVRLNAPRDRRRTAGRIPRPK